MSDRISIEGLCVETRIGVTQKERSRPQDVLVDIEVAADLARSAATDALQDTIDYDSLVAEVAALIRASECNLLETLAANIAGLVSAKQGVFGVTVGVRKVEVPVNEDVSSIGVRIERGELGRDRG